MRAIMGANGPGTDVALLPVMITLCPQHAHPTILCNPSSPAALYGLVYD